MMVTQIAGTVETKLEVVVIPVADVERAKRFYEGAGALHMENARR
jgi:catechol 2,3-dioxygenase-like lactoylglutathione lyase family enzyme